MANKKKIPARALACLLSTAMVPGSLPMDVLTVYGAEAKSSQTERQAKRISHHLMRMQWMMLLRQQTLHPAVR